MRRALGSARAGWLARVRVRVAALAVLAVAGGLLAGCTDADPSPAPPSSSSPGGASTSPAVSPSPTEFSSAPPRAETPVEFIERLVSAQNLMLSTGDTDPYEELVNRRCRTCRDLVRRVRSVYSAGGSIQTDGWEVQEVVSEGGSKSKPVIRVWVESSATTYTETEGGPEKSFEGGRLLEQFELIRSRAEWSLGDYKEVST